MKPRIAKWQQDGSSTLDLFGEIAVTLADIEHWLDSVPYITPTGFRRDNYKQNWDVKRRVQEAKANGTWPPALRT